MASLNFSTRPFLKKPIIILVVALVLLAVHSLLLYYVWQVSSVIFTAITIVLLGLIVICLIMITLSLGRQAIKDLKSTTSTDINNQLPE